MSKVTEALALGYTMLPCGPGCTEACRMDAPNMHTWIPPERPPAPPPTTTTTTATAKPVVEDPARLEARRAALTTLDNYVRIEVPNHQRDRQILAAYELGATIDALARSAELTHVRIRQILKKGKDRA